MLSSPISKLIMGSSPMGKSGLGSGTFHQIVPFILSLLVGIFLQTYIIQGHALDEDYAAYLQEAYNIAHHQPLNELGVDYYFDPNVTLSNQGPASYPLLLPVLYALPVAVFGYNIELIKELHLALLVIGLLMFSYAMRSWGYTVVAISTSLMVFGLSTEIRGSVNSIGSDLPFLLFLMMALLAIDRASRAPARTALAWGIAMGAAIYLATELRTVGVILLPTAWLVGVIRHRQIVRAEIVTAALAFAVCYGAQYVLLGSTEAYGVVSNGHFLTPLENLQQFYWAIAGSWRTSHQSLELVLLVLVAFAGIGVATGFARGSAPAVFLVCYTGLLLILPDLDVGARLLIPHLLFFGAFVCNGAEVCARWFMKAAPAASIRASLGASAIATVLFAVSDPAYPSGMKVIGTNSAPVREVLAYVKETVPADALVSTTKYRSFHLFTDHRTIKLLGTRSTEELSLWLREKKVDYLILKDSPANPEIAFSDCPMSPACKSDQLGVDVEEIWRNSDFRVLHIK